MITAITTTKGTMDMKMDILQMTKIKKDMKTDTPTIIIMKTQRTIKHTQVNIELNKRLQNHF